MNIRTVRFNIVESIGIITLCQSGMGDNIEEQMSQEMAEICQAINIEDTVRAVVVTGDNTEAFAWGFVPDKYPESAISLPFIAKPVAELACPTIAAIKGDALGQGLELALACDIRIAANQSHFGISHIASGILPWDGAIQRLLRIVGFSKAMEMILTGESINAKEALRIGLINKVVSDKEVVPVAESMAKSMAIQSPLALRFAKEAVTKGMDLTLEQGLRLEADLYFLMQTTEDRIEGIEAFRQKRPPRFKGK